MELSHAANGSQSDFITDLRSENAELKVKAKELEDRYKDQLNVHFHSRPNSTGEEATPIDATGSQSISQVPQPPIWKSYADHVEPPPSSFWPRPERVAARESLHTGPSLLSSSGPSFGNAQRRDASADTGRAASTFTGVEQPRTKEAEAVNFEPWPSINVFREWK